MSIYDVATALAACLCAQLATDNTGADTHLGEMCFCGVVAGAQVVEDNLPTCRGKDGTAWVRVGLGYPAKAVGQVAESVDNCSLTLGFDLEVGIVRNRTAGAKGYSAVDHAEMARISLHDMYTMKRAIVCCSALDSNDFILGTYAPIGPVGFAYGGQWGLHVQVP